MRKVRCKNGVHVLRQSKLGRAGAILHQVCGHCGETLSLGRAAKADPVEVRAAAVIIGHGRWIGTAAAGCLTGMECVAWRECELYRSRASTYREDRGMPKSEAGWLAYEISTHDAQRAEEYRARHGLAATDPVDPAEVERDIPPVPAPTAAPWEHATPDQILSDIATTVPQIDDGMAFSPEMGDADPTLDALPDTSEADGAQLRAALGIMPALVIEADAPEADEEQSDETPLEDDDAISDFDRADAIAAQDQMIDADPDAVDAAIVEALDEQQPGSDIDSSILRCAIADCRTTGKCQEPDYCERPSSRDGDA